MSQQAQIAADEALARHLQDEENASRTMQMFFDTGNPNQHHPPHTPSPRRSSSSLDTTSFDFPFAHGQDSFNTDDMFREFFGRVLQPNALDSRPRARDQALDGLSRFGTGRYLRSGGHDRSRGSRPSEPSRTPSSASPRRSARPQQQTGRQGGRNPRDEMEAMLRDALGVGMSGAGGNGPSFVGGSFFWSPDGITRIESSRRPGPAGSQRGGGGGGGGVDMRDMLDMMFNGMLGGEQGGGGSDGGGLGPNMADWIRSVLPNGGTIETPETYEDWLSLIETMGGDVNRGATDEEIGNIRAEKFKRATKRKKREISSGGAGPSRVVAEEEEEEEKCAICLGEYENGEDVKYLACGHMFHAECVDRWLKVNKVCPICKQSIRMEEGRRTRR